MSDIMRKVKRVIPGCQHDIVRMNEWCLEGACPICLTADAGIKKDEITRLTAELEQARNTIKFMHDYEESTLRLSDSYKQRAEAAEQQVAALVEALKEAREWIGSVACNGSYSGAATNYINGVLSTIPDRAKKIQAVVEAAKREVSEDTLESQLNLIRTVRDLES